MKCSICPHKAYPECKATCTEYKAFVDHARKHYEGRRKDVELNGYIHQHFDDYDHTPTNRRKGSYT